MSVFNLEEQNSDINSRIVAGLERLSQVFRTLLWDKAREHNLSPIQIQLLIFIMYHSPEMATVTYLAREFRLTKPTISDAIKILEQKKIVRKSVSSADSRSYFIQLTALGKKIVSETENYARPLVEIISRLNENDKQVLWKNIANFILTLNRLEVISVQRTCFNCKHHTVKNGNDFCNLLNQKLLTKDIRIDCAEFETAATPV